MSHATADSTEARLLAEIWKTAYARGGVNLPMTHASDAKRLRMQLYNIVATHKKRRDRGQDYDKSLLQSAAECAITVPGSEAAGYTLSIQPRVNVGALLGAAAALGISAEDHTPEGRVAADLNASMLRLEDLVEPESATEPGVATNLPNLPAYLRRS